MRFKTLNSGKRRKKNRKPKTPHGIFITFFFFSTCRNQEHDWSCTKPDARVCVVHHPSLRTSAKSGISCPRQPESGKLTFASLVVLPLSGRRKIVTRRHLFPACICVLCQLWLLSILRVLRCSVCAPESDIDRKLRCVVQWDPNARSLSQSSGAQSS